MNPTQKRQHQRVIEILATARQRRQQEFAISSGGDQPSSGRSQINTIPTTTLPHEEERLEHIR